MLFTKEDQEINRKERIKEILGISTNHKAESTNNNVENLITSKGYTLKQVLSRIRMNTSELEQKVKHNTIKANEQKEILRSLKGLESYKQR